MYYIGINFNNRGTTASCYDTANPEKGVWRLLLREREDVEDDMLETAVWYDERADEWCFLSEKKAKMERGREKKKESHKYLEKSIRK